MNVYMDYGAAYLARLEESVLDRIELELGQDHSIVRLRTTGLIFPDELARWTERVREGVRRSRVDMVLDLGCGLGAFGRHVSSVNGAGVIGLDISDIAIEAARLAAEQDGNATFLLSAAHKSGLPTSSIGAAIALDLFHLIPDPEGVANELARTLARDASLTATTYTTGKTRPDCWTAALRSAGFQHILLRDMTAPWRSWMYRRQQRRLERFKDIERELGVDGAGYIALARQLLGDGKQAGAIDSMARWWIEADR